MASPYWDLGVGGALLTELDWGGHVEVAPRTTWAAALPSGAAEVVRVTAAPAPTDPVLVEAVGLVAAKERKPRQVVEHLGRELGDALFERLEAERILRSDTQEVRGLAGRMSAGWPS